MKSSADSPRSNGTGLRETALIVTALSVLAAGAIAWCFQHGYILYYGDAQSHLNISRSIFDSRTPGYDQFGTVWLPVLHLLCLPFVTNNMLWTTGLAGAIPVAMSFVLAGAFLYFVAKQSYASSVAAAVVVGCFALNPNVLYLASAPMTEMPFLVGLALLLFALIRFRASPHWYYIALAVLASWWMSLTRYDGWFLIPFVALALAILSQRKRWLVLLVTGIGAALAPLYWIANNWWVEGNPFDFYNGPYSAVAIQHGAPYPGYHNWLLAAVYYSGAGALCAGWSLLGLGAIGTVCAIRKRAVAPIVFLLLTPIFYIWSMHSSGGTPIYIPPLWPYSYYNSRYGIALVVVCAFAAGAIVLVLPVTWKRHAWLLIPLSAAFWLLPLSPGKWVCWKESQVNSISRRAWINTAADFLNANYRSGQGILMASGSGDISGILCRARIPLREALYMGNGPAWYLNSIRPDLVHQQLWALAQDGDFIDRGIKMQPHAAYSVAREIRVPGAPVVRIYRRRGRAAQ